MHLGVGEGGPRGDMWVYIYIYTHTHSLSLDPRFRIWVQPKFSCGFYLYFIFLILECDEFIDYWCPCEDETWLCKPRYPMKDRIFWHMIRWATTHARQIYTISIELCPFTCTHRIYIHMHENCHDLKRMVGSHRYSLLKVIFINKYLLLILLKMSVIFWY